MIEFKGTKGKWVVDEKENWFDVQTENNDRIVSVDKSDVKFAKHDALLISKAPEMLEMLFELHSLLEENLPNWYTQGHHRSIEKLIKEATEI